MAWNALRKSRLTAAQATSHWPLVTSKHNSGFGLSKEHNLCVNNSQMWKVICFRNEPINEPEGRGRMTLHKGARHHL